MTTPPTSQRPDYVNVMATRLGIDPQKLWDELREEVREGHLRLAAEDDTIPAGVTGFQLLGAFVAGEGRPTDVPVAAGAGLTALGRRLELRDVTPEQAERRPQIEGFTEALFDWINWARAQDRVPQRVQDNVPLLQGLYGQVAIKRPLLDKIDEFREWLVGDVGTYEREACDVMAHDYGLMRQQVKEDRTWARDLERVEDYLYGAARAAVETRAAGVDMKRKLTEKVGPAVHEAGVKEGERRVKEQLKAAMDERAAEDSGQGTDRRGDQR